MIIIHFSHVILLRNILLYSIISCLYEQETELTNAYSYQLFSDFFDFLFQKNTLNNHCRCFYVYGIIQYILICLN